MPDEIPSEASGGILSSVEDAALALSGGERMANRTRIRTVIETVSTATAPLPKRASDVLIDILASEGVDTIFGLPGGTIAPYNDALLGRSDIRVITTRHESGAVFAAAGYAQATGKPGVVLVTSGPGLLNTVTGIASAFCDGIPVVVLAGEVPRSVQGKGALQEGSSHHLNVVGLVRHITKLAGEIPEAAAAPAMLHGALVTARSGRPGPVVVTLPMDVSTALIRPPRLVSSSPSELLLDAEALEPVVDVLSDAVRPLLFAGAGLRNGEDARRLRAFAERVQWPVATTPKGKGVFPESHPLSVGVFGMGGHPSASEYLQQGIDVLLAIGTSLGDLATDGWSPLLKPGRALVHVDVDASRLGRTYPVTHGVVSTAGAFFEHVTPRLPRCITRRRFGVRTHVDPLRISAGTPGTLAPQRAIYEIQQGMPPGTVFTVDSGEHFLYATHYLRAESPDSHIVMSGLGSMGSSIGSALGIAAARPDKSVAVIMGDGGFAMVGSEIGTAVQEGLPLTIFVFNDGRLGMCEIGHDALYGRTPAWPIALDIPAFARSLGAESFAARTPEELSAGLEKRRPDRTLVVDVRIDPTARMPKNARLDAMGRLHREGKTSTVATRDVLCGEARNDDDDPAD